MEETEEKSIPELIEELFDVVSFQLWKHRFDRCIQELKQREQRPIFKMHDAIVDINLPIEDVLSDHNQTHNILETTPTPQEHQTHCIDSRMFEDDSFDHNQTPTFLETASTSQEKEHNCMTAKMLEGSCVDDLIMLDWKREANQSNMEAVESFDLLKYGKELFADIEITRALEDAQLTQVRQVFDKCFEPNKSVLSLEKEKGDMSYCTRINVGFKEWKGGTIAWTLTLGFTCNTAKFSIVCGRGKIYLVAGNKVLKLNFLDVESSQPIVEFFFGPNKGLHGEGKIVGLSENKSTSYIFVNVSRGLAAYIIQGRIIIRLVFLWFGYRLGCRKELIDCYFASASVIDPWENSVYSSNTAWEFYSSSLHGIRLHVSNAIRILTQDFILQGGCRYPLYSRVVGAELPKDIGVTILGAVPNLVKTWRITNCMGDMKCKFNGYHSGEASFGTNLFMAAVATPWLLYSSQAFELIYCSRCITNWTSDDGFLLLRSTQRSGQEDTLLGQHNHFTSTIKFLNNKGKKCSTLLLVFAGNLLRRIILQYERSDP